MISTNTPTSRRRRCRRNRRRRTPSPPPPPPPPLLHSRRHHPSKSTVGSNRSITPTCNMHSCTKCGASSLTDITKHEFPDQKGLIFECLSCGNNSMQSNISDGERQRRLALIANDHLNTMTCQFCHRLCSSSQDYLLHLRNDHHSNKSI
jgi:hypothetical protein